MYGQYYPPIQTPLNVNSYPWGQSFSQPQQMQRPQAPILAGQMVDSVDAVKAKDIDLTGQPNYYPNTNGQEIYRKQLQLDGTCQILTYKLVPVAAPEQPTQTVNQNGDMQSMLDQMEERLLAKIKEMIG